MDRIRTGNDELDLILDGGFPASSIHIVMGAPGTGKTMLAEQLAFANATRDRPALYVTTVSEPLAKFITYLQEYAFADASRIGEDVIYASLGDALAERPDQLTELVTRLLQEHRPGVLVIDSFKAIADLMPDRATWRRQLHALAGLLSAYATTSFWVGEYTSDMKAQLPEFAVADGVVELTREQHGSRDFRFVHVVKLRGSSFLDGYHALHITRSGLEIFPRLRTPVVSTDYRPIDERLSSGIPALDAMIASGWLRGTATIVQGPSGAGKTAMALHFAREGVAQGEPALFVTFEENPIQLERIMQRFGWDLSAVLGPGKLDVFFASPVELQIDTIVRELFSRIEKYDVRRVVIDGVGDLAYTADSPTRFRDYLFAMTQQLAIRNVTSMSTVQSSAIPGAELMAANIAYLADNLVLLEMRMNGELERFVRIVKTRGSAHDPNAHPLSIGPRGIGVR